jgi:hypothetical protein
MKLKITKIQYLHYKVCVYIIVIVAAGISGYIDYQRWLNPLGMKAEVNPKQHNGAQEFTPPTVFESSVTLPDGRPTSTLILKEEAEQASPLTEEDLAVFDELDKMDEEYPGEIVVDH